MSDRQARGAEKAMQEADAEFRRLPGAGKPLNNLGDNSDDWWLRQKTTRENIGDDALPATMRLRKEVAALTETLDALDAETAVRDHLEQLNQRIRAALIGPPDGPPLHFGPLDIDTETAAWRQRRR
ncbi:hypothetical protein GCM10029992_44750 [Glycomyces albus]